MLTGACGVNQLFDHTGDEITLRRRRADHDLRRGSKGNSWLSGRQARTGTRRK
jgi:hypothetical protein